MQHQNSVVTLFVDAAPIVLVKPDPESAVPAEDAEKAVEEPMKPPSQERRRAVTADDRRRVRAACQGSPEEVLVSLAVPIARSDLRTLQGKQWLNDEIINGYMDLINRRDLATHSQQRTIYAFSCFFYTQLSIRGYAYHRVRNWTTEVDVLKLERLIVPINIGNIHWCLAVVNLKARRFEYYDSLGHSNDECLPRLRRWLQDESQDKHQQTYSLAGWTDVQPRKQHQRNSYDCGVFAARAAECVALDIPFDFTQKDTPSLRILMSLQLLDSAL